jgi:hypothetical protein
VGKTYKDKAQWKRKGDKQGRSFANSGSGKRFSQKDIQGYMERLNATVSAPTSPAVAGQVVDEN